MQRVIVLVITCAVGLPAFAHVAPSVDDNNRYLKVTPAADRLRVAYTVFFGENPGRQMRPSLDADHDGVISDEESGTFGAKLAREVADGIDLTVDGAHQAIEWSTVAVGLGTPEVAAGSFSVDMIAYLCLPESTTDAKRHVVLLKDRFRIPRPGETEVKVEDAVGITIEHARVGPFDAPEHDYKLVGPGGPLMDDGLDLAFVVTERAPRGDETCANAAPRTSAHGNRPGLLLAVGGAITAIVIALVFVLVRRTARRARRT